MTGKAEPARQAERAGLGPVRVPRAADEVVDRLLTAIALGEFSLGERLPPERELAEQLGVSRPTVRTAVARLREIGCLEVVRGRSGGHYVRSDWRTESAEAVRRTLAPRWEKVTTLLDTRCLIESLIARTAAERRTEAEIEHIEAALAEYESATEPAEVRKTSAALHEAIARAAHNDPLAVHSAQLLREITAGFPIEPYSGNLTERSLDEHRALARAVIAGEAGRAAEIAREHFTITGENLRAILDRSESEA